MKSIDLQAKIHISSLKNIVYSYIMFINFCSPIIKTENKLHYIKEVSIPIGVND